MNAPTQILPEFFTVKELADARLIGLEMNVRNLRKYVDKNNWRKKTSPDGQPYARKRQGRGGGWEYHINLLEPHQRRELARNWGGQQQTSESTAPKNADQKLWQEFNSLPLRAQNFAKTRLEVLHRVESYLQAGETKDNSCKLAAADYNKSVASVYNWFNKISGVDRHNWLPKLAAKNKGSKGRISDCSDDAWAAFKADYLRLEKPPATACYFRLKRMGEERGWTVPSKKALTNRLDREIKKTVQVLLREGHDALQRMFAPQERDRSIFHALEGVQSDGHTMDCWVKWHDGTIIRPTILAISDLYSNKILAYRVDKSESTTAVRLAFYDLFREWGIPDFVLFDNGRSFASKQITGGQSGRNRFKEKNGENEGILTTLGVKVHWATVRHGQAKPIERTFREISDYIAADPQFAGSYAGKSPTRKPAYKHDPRDKSVPFEIFMSVFEQGIIDLNARGGRRTGVCAGKFSFDQVYEASYAKSLIKKASEAQLHMAMMASEKVTARKPDGAVYLLKNRFWSEFMVEHIGARVTLRYDPEDAHAGVHVYDHNGAFLGTAECKEKVGFHSKEAARLHGRKRRDFMKATKVVADIENSMSLSEFDRTFPETGNPPTEKVASKVIRMIPPNQVQPHTEEPQFHEDKEGVISMVELSAAMQRMKEAENK